MESLQSDPFTSAGREPMAANSEDEEWKELIRQDSLDAKAQAQENFTINNTAMSLLAKCRKMGRMLTIIFLL